MRASYSDLSQLDQLRVRVTNLEKDPESQQPSHLHASYTPLDKHWTSRDNGMNTVRSAGVAVGCGREGGREVGGGWGARGYTLVGGLPWTGAGRWGE